MCPGLRAFVKFNDHEGDPVQLAKELLHEVPAQVEQYLALYGATPAPEASAAFADPSVGL